MENHVSVLEESLDVEKKEWPILRIGWVLMGIFVLMGFLGFFGAGLFSDRTVNTSAFSVKYERFLRYSMSAEILIKAPVLGPDSSVTVNSDYAHKFRIDKINPEPESISLEGRNLKIKFGSRSANDIVFFTTPLRKGSQDLSIEINGVKKVVSQYIYL